VDSVYKYYNYLRYIKRKAEVIIYGGGLSSGIPIAKNIKDLDAS